MNWFFGIFFSRKSNDEEASLEELSKPDGAPIEIIWARQEEARANLENLETPKNPVELTEQIAELAAKLLSGLISKRTMLSEGARLRLAETMDNLKISGKSVSSDSSAIKQLLSCRPLWLASILGSPKRLPLEAGMFDIVVFDEASQCDIASTIPLFARAKRVVIVGDNRQLSFIPQLGRIKDRNFMQTQGLPVSNMGRFAQSQLSLFDFARRIPNVPSVFLRE